MGRLPIYKAVVTTGPTDVYSLVSSNTSSHH
jgi:hypothetical protein